MNMLNSLLLSQRLPGSMTLRKPCTVSSDTPNAARSFRKTRSFATCCSVRNQRFTESSTPSTSTGSSLTSFIFVTVRVPLCAGFVSRDAAPFRCNRILGPAPLTKPRNHLCRPFPTELGRVAREFGYERADGGGARGLAGREVWEKASRSRGSDFRQAASGASARRGGRFSVCVARPRGSSRDGPRGSLWPALREAAGTRTWSRWLRCPPARVLGVQNKIGALPLPCGSVASQRVRRFAHRAWRWFVVGCANHSL